MDLPDYDPRIDSPPLSDAELDTLDALLQALPGDRAMNIEGLDGYLTALLLGPRPPAGRPSADWLPPVWGADRGAAGEGPAPFASQKQRKRAALLVLRHLHAVDLALAGPPERWEPVFSVAEADGREFVDAEDWCIGFLQAVDLDGEAWAPLFDDPALSPALVPLALLGGDEAGLSAADRERLADPQARDELSRAVIDAVLLLQARRAANAAPAGA